MDAVESEPINIIVFLIIQNVYCYLVFRASGRAAKSIVYADDSGKPSKYLSWSWNPVGTAFFRLRICIFKNGNDPVPRFLLYESDQDGHFSIQ